MIWCFLHFWCDGTGAVQAPMSVICNGNYRELLSHANYPVILQMSCVNNYSNTTLKSVSITTVHFPFLWLLLCLSCSHAPLSPSVYLDKLQLVGNAHPQGNDKYPLRMDSQSSNSRLKRQRSPRRKYCNSISLSLFLSLCHVRSL